MAPSRRIVAPGVWRTAGASIQRRQLSMVFAVMALPGPVFDTLGPNRIDHFTGSNE
jgi:hypothetical protein